MQPKVSVVVSSYKSEPQMLDDRLGNLFSQSLTDIEVILVLNAPDEGCKEVVRTFSDDPRLRVLVAKREGIYASWNRGFRVASGEYVTNANVDDRHLLHGLSTLAGALDTHQEVGLVYGDSLVVTKVPEPLDTLEDMKLCHVQPYPNGNLGLRDFVLDDLLAGHNIGNCPMWRRSLHAQHGWFDENMQLAADYEWALRLQSRGVSFYYTKETVATFYFGRNATTVHQSQSDYEATFARLRWMKALTHDRSSRPNHARRN